jgi:RNA polymerase sigma-70 factor (ECF subfamily)
MLYRGVGENNVPTDEELALGIQQGRASDLSALVERHYDALTGYLYRMTGGDRLLSEDMVQETFLNVLRGIKSYSYPRPFKPWLYAIATNLIRNHYKSADTRRALALEEDHEESLTVEFEIDPDAHELMTALKAMPDHQREVIVLRYSLDMSLDEIGQVLNIPVGTVKSRLSLGLRRLRTEMERS